MFEVKESEQKRLWHIITHNPKRKKFFWFETTDGFDIVISVQDIHFINFLWDHDIELADQVWRTAVNTIEEEDDDDLGTPPIKLFFRGRSQPLETYTVIDGTYSILEALCELDLLEKKGNDFVLFSDEEDETVALNPNQLVMLIIPSKEVPEFN
ncbi:MAG: hypothetical protein GY931_19755, partial [Maribacter sp.]|nr:hypothetical protein [Maribacter sp.]